MIKTFILVVVALCLVGCSTVKLPNDPAKTYKMDINIENKEYNAVGMIVLPSKPLYTITFETDEKINYISFRTCSREVTQEDPRTGISRKKYLINYKPNEIEYNAYCPAMISAFNEKGMLSVGFIDFLDSSVTLSALNICGESTVQTLGASVCQERVSSIERIKFTDEVLASPDSECELDSPLKGKEFNYKIKKGLCVFSFIETRPPYREHRLTTFGYDNINVR